MKTWFIVGLSLLAVSLSGCTFHVHDKRPDYAYPAPPSPAPSPEAEVDIAYFYDALAPYGDWVVVAGYGRCWVPRGVPIGWRPYSRGHWVYTEFGLCWVSDEDWGWACFHYGRWLLTARFGWCWVPGTVWAPNWCAWRWGDDWCAWAPLPPSVRFSFRFGLSVGDLDLDALIEPSWWCCCRHGLIFEPRIHEHIVPFTRNVTILHVTKNVTKIVVRDHHVVGDSIRRDRLERALGRRLEPWRLAEADSPRHAGRRGEEGHELRVYRPERHREVVGAPGRPRPIPRLVPPEEQRRRSEEHARRYEEYLQSQRREMERRQQEELAQPPPGARREELGRRHDEERRILEEHTRRQREELQRHEQEGRRGLQGPGEEGRRERLQEDLQRQRQGESRGGPQGGGKEEGKERPQEDLQRQRQGESQRGPQGGRREEGEEKPREERDRQGRGEGD